MTKERQYALEQQMYEGGPWHRTVTGDYQSVLSHAKGRKQTNPKAKLRIRPI